MLLPHTLIMKGTDVASLDESPPSGLGDNVTYRRINDGCTDGRTEYNVSLAQPYHKRK